MEGKRDLKAGTQERGMNDKKVEKEQKVNRNKKTKKRKKKKRRKG